MTQPIVKKMDQKKYDKIKDNLNRTAGRFAQNTYMKAISSAMMGLMPIMMISSFVSVISVINVGGFQDFLANSGLGRTLSHINTMTVGIASVYTAFIIAYRLGQGLKKDPLHSGVIGLLSFFILTPLTAGEGFNGISVTNMGQAGLFVAMFAGLFGTRVYALLVDRDITIKMPDGVPPMVAKNFSSIIPAILVATVMGAISFLVALTPQGDMITLLNQFIQAPLMSLGANIWSAMFLVGFIQVLWFFGIHGPMAVMPVIMTLYQAPQMANLEAFGAGMALPFLFTTGFVMGNRGARSFAMVLVGLFRCKSTQLKTVSKVGLIPSLFGISEPMNFGVPQVMNIRMLIPSVITPPISLLSAYILSIIGFLPYHNGVNIPVGFPIIVNGLVNHGWQGIVAQIIQLVLCILIYLPFMLSQDKAYLQEEAKAAQEKEATFQQAVVTQA